VPAPGNAGTLDIGRVNVYNADIHRKDTELMINKLPTERDPDIFSVTYEASDRAGHEPYMVVIRHSGHNACSCPDWFKKTQLEGLTDHICKHSERRARAIVAAEQGVAVAATASVPGRPLPPNVAQMPQRSSKSVPFA